MGRAGSRPGWGSLRTLIPAMVLTCALGDPGAHGGDGRRSLADRLRLGPGVSNHPVKVIPSDDIEIPEGWPLDFDGSLTCRTCHEQLPSLAGGVDPHLRETAWPLRDSSEFCTKCHSGEFGGNRVSMHWIVTGVAHIHEEQAERRQAVGMLDPATRRCLECHDGVNATDSLNSTPWSDSRASKGDHRKNHPIGVKYPSGKRKGIGPGFRPINRLPSGMHLPDGTVGCTSCHDLYAVENQLLIVPIRGSALCLSCHDT